MNGQERRKGHKERGDRLTSFMTESNLFALYSSFIVESSHVSTPPVFYGACLPGLSRADPITGLCKVRPEFILEA